MISQFTSQIKLIACKSLILFNKKLVIKFKKTLKTVPKVLEKGAEERVNAGVIKSRYRTNIALAH